MDRMFKVQKSWAEALRFPDPAVVERNLSYHCPRYLDAWNYIEDDAVPQESEDGKRCVPVGTIQHAQKWLETLGGADVSMTPLEVPYAMSEFCGREYFWSKGSDIPRECLDGSKWFLKDVSSLKTWTSLLYDDGDLSYYIDPSHLYSVSEKVNLVGEWRCFVYEDEILSCESYSGSPIAFPSENVLSQMLGEYAKVSHPRAYTLDVGVSEDSAGRHTIPLEVHPFVACGLYGFNGPELADMYDAGWLWYKDEYVEDEGRVRYIGAC